MAPRNSMYAHPLFFISPRVRVYDVAAPVAALVAIGVDGKVAVVELRVVDVAVHGHLVEHFQVALVFAEPSDLPDSRRVKGDSTKKDEG